MHGILVPRRAHDVAWFKERLLEIAGTPAALWIPRIADTTTNITAPDTRTWTNANTQLGRTSPMGEFVGVTFNGTTDAITATDSGLAATNADRTLIALIKPTAVNVTDNPIFGYGTATAKHAILWELNNAKQRVGLFGTNSDLATTSQAAGKSALLGVQLSGGDTFAFWNNGAADGTATAIASISTTLVGAGGALIGDTPQPGTWGLGNKGNITTAFLLAYNSILTARHHRALAQLCREFYGVALP